MNWYKVLKIVIVCCLVSFHSTRAAPPEIDIKTDPTGKLVSIKVKSDNLFMRNIIEGDYKHYRQIFSNPITMAQYMDGSIRPDDEIKERYEKYLSWWQSGRPFTSYLVYLDENEAKTFLQNNEQKDLSSPFTKILSAEQPQAELKSLGLSLESFTEEFEASRKIFMGHVLLEEGEDRLGEGIETDAELSYVFLPAFWSKGYGTEAVKNIIELAKIFHQRDFLLDSHPIDTLIATALPENPGSCKVLEKNRFTFTPQMEEEKYGALRRLYIRPLSEGEHGAA
jgi:RimJ/RimL family protein N-acetyltransferase